MATQEDFEKQQEEAKAKRKGVANDPIAVRLVSGLVADKMVNAGPSAGRAASEALKDMAIAYGVLAAVIMVENEGADPLQDIAVQDALALGKAAADKLYEGFKKTKEGRK